MTDNRCGTCRHLLTSLGKSTPAWGYCTWADTHDVPYSMQDKDFMVFESDGGLCKFWQAKETANG